MKFLIFAIIGTIALANYSIRDDFKELENCDTTANCEGGLVCMRVQCPDGDIRKKCVEDMPGRVLSHHHHHDSNQTQNNTFNIEDCFDKTNLICRTDSGCNSDELCLKGVNEISQCYPKQCHHYIVKKSQKTPSSVKNIIDFDTCFGEGFSDCIKLESTDTCDVGFVCKQRPTFEWRCYPTTCFPDEELVLKAEEKKFL